MGWPAQSASRKGDLISNAEVAYLFSVGSPLRNQPARPILEPALSKPENKERYTAELGKAAAAVTAQQPEQARKHLERAGMLATNAVKRYFTAGNNWEPNAPATIRRKGSSRPGIDTAQMRNSCTYSVRESGEVVAAPTPEQVESDE